jgi:energy-coupling factor transport system ATP-binding protein
MIELRDVYFSYPVRRENILWALRKVDLWVSAGSYVTLMGPNGSGKSTLGKLVKGLLSPTSGQVFIGGHPLKPGTISSQVGYIFSNPENQIISSVVEEDVAFGLENMGVPHAHIARKVQESLSWVGMEKYRYHSPHLLSGGQQQKIVLAGILAMESEILVFDEPTAMLDLEDRREILGLIQKAHRQGGKTILHITHSLEEAMQSQDLIFLDRGRVIFMGAVEHFLAEENWAELSGLSLSPLDRLVRSLCSLGYPIPGKVHSVSALKSLLLNLKQTH